jgi:D-alanyl-D-alanine carboxypeptidase (penicillin-binding protein 5/6)
VSRLSGQFALIVQVYGVDSSIVNSYNTGTLKKPFHLCFIALLLLRPVTITAQDAFRRSFDGELTAASAVVMDAATGAALFEKNPDWEIPPASLTKLMTMYIALTEAQSGRVSLSDAVDLPPPTWARNQPPRSSLMWLDQGHLVTLHELLLGLAIPSGNDAAVAVALHIAPTIEDFAAMMNAQARRIGLTRTRFVEPSGISEKNMTTAGEFARFCREYLRAYPETIAGYHTVPALAYPQEENLPVYQRGKTTHTIVQPNHIPLLGTFDGVDGLKTGYIDEAGFNAAVTAQQNDTRFIVVVLGIPASLGAPVGDRARAEDCRKLLEWAFANYKTLRPPTPEIPAARLWKSKRWFTPLRLTQDTETTALIDRGEGLRWEIEPSGPLIAPLPAGTAAGKLRLYDKDGLLREIPLVTAEEAERGNFWRRLWDSIVLLFH